MRTLNWHFVFAVYNQSRHNIPLNIDNWFPKQNLWHGCGKQDYWTASLKPRMFWKEESEIQTQLKVV